MTQGNKLASIATGNIQPGVVKRVTNVDDACWKFPRYTPTNAAMIEVATPYPSSNYCETRLKCRRLRLGKGVNWD